MFIFRRKQPNRAQVARQAALTSLAARLRTNAAIRGVDAETLNRALAQLDAMPTSRLIALDREFSDAES